MQDKNATYWQEGIDSKALLVCLLQKLPYMLLLGVTGAVLGSGLYLLIAVMTYEGPKYQAETEYYIDFAEGRLEAKDHYNDFTWNDVMATNLILGNTMNILGATYDRNTVKEMITADILSDVRYLTITVEGSDAEIVEEISNATRISIEKFGISKDEFDSIEQIEDNGVQEVKEKLFTWRAAFLGAFVGFFTGMFWMIGDFCLGSRFYTKRSIQKCLGIPVFGMLYTRNNEAEGTQEKALQLSLQHRMDKAACKQLVMIDVTERKCAQRCQDELVALYTDEQLGVELSVEGFPIQSKEAFTKMREAEGVILAIPFAKSCREAVIEVINQLENQECKILGAILVDVDKKWMKMYGIR